MLLTRVYGKNTRPSGRIRLVEKIIRIPVYNHILRWITCRDVASTTTHKYKYKYEYQTHKYKYKYKYLGHKYKYKYKYLGQKYEYKYKYVQVTYKYIRKSVNTLINTDSIILS